MTSSLLSALSYASPDLPELTFVAEPGDRKLVDVLARWHAWPKANGLPGRAQFDPAEMPQLLPHLALVEYDAHANPHRPYDALFRYIGSRIGEDFRMSQHTRQYLSDFSAQIAERWFPVHDHLRHTRAPFAIQGVPVLLDKSYLRFEVVYLPLSRGDATSAAQQQATEPPEVAFALFAAHFSPNLEE